MEPTIEPMDQHFLDNPIWHSLNGHHAALALGGASVRRYLPGIAEFAGFPDGGAPDWPELAKLMTVGEHIITGNYPVPLGAGFESVWAADTQIHQYVYWVTTLRSLGDFDISELQNHDIPEMLRLVKVNRPGPFVPQAIRMGRYVGIRADGQLVAMAGERMHPGRFCEISGVCTDPAYVRRGFATRLVRALIAQILERGEIPFLTVNGENASAIRLYQKLGFVWRGYFPFQWVKFVGLEDSLQSSADQPLAAARSVSDEQHQNPDDAHSPQR